ncbi:MAG: FAD-binding oxidoreductase [Mariprofundaceae bacterium]|nr:FAD-binding oxidoreductase [Mariprofundaceae bacterium]
MPVITFEGKEYHCKEGETVLESLTRHGVLIPSACHSGVCQTCITKAVKGTPPVESQKGLKDTLADQNYFLACICKPEEDLELALADVSKAIEATITEKTLLNESVVRIRLQTEQPLDYIAGQFINVKHPETGVTRSYSLASLPRDGFLELHVKRVPDGHVSGYFHDDAALGDKLSIMGPVGDCFYTDRDLDQPLLLVGVGTGLAPLHGILRDALVRGHRGEIHLFHASLATQGLYYTDELSALAAKNEQVHYIPCVLHGDAPHGGEQGDLQQVLKKSKPDLKGWRVYVCGDPAIVNGLKQACFMSGANMTDIYSDPFVFDVTP